MDIDESRSDDFSRGVDRLLCFFFDLRGDRDDLSMADANV